MPIKKPYEPPIILTFPLKIRVSAMLQTANTLREIADLHKDEIMPEEALALKAAQEALADIARRRAIEIAKEGGAL